ncbi:MAG TPA: phospholipase D-like domain-containing protein, partial [Bdellovibrio sp.]|nr:phospholipase D-like domain-containing protein [Bdellovibrio sp.]
MKFQAFINLIMILASLPVMAADGNSARSTYVFKTTDPQEMTVVNVGALSLAKRLDMIAKAKRSIEVEFFIYNIDQSGRLFTQALVKKAQEGVHVRVLVDYGFPIGKLDPYYATLLRDHGVEIRYYNPNLSFELLRGQFRSHRKGLVVDDQEAVTGGRNIADEYFDLAPDYNFLDRDVFVKGSMAKAVRESFDLFWSSNMTKEPERMTKPTKEAYSLAEPLSGPDDQRTLRQYEKDLARYEQETARATSYMTE